MCVSVRVSYGESFIAAVPLLTLIVPHLSQIIHLSESDQHAALGCFRLSLTFEIKRSVFWV